MTTRCRTDRQIFARYYFHEKLIDDKTRKPIPFSKAHLDALALPKPGYRERGPDEGWRRARMLPRGNGKTTVFIRIDVCHDIVYELERFVVILAASADLARSRVFEIAVELEGNARLRRDYGDLVGGDVWRRSQGYICTANDITILSRSMGGQQRGLLHPVTNARPTKILIDDGENSKDVLNPALRERDKRRLTQDIEGATNVAGTTVIQMTGTPLHREALLPSLKNNPGWDFASYPAIISWPKRLDLWERCRLLWAAAGAPDEKDKLGDAEQMTATSAALRFYLAHKKEMDEGVEVLWPDREPIFRLMVYRWTNGERAFAQEKLLEPRDPSIATFDMERAIRHTLYPGYLLVDVPGDAKPRRVELQNCNIVTTHDPCGADPTAKKKTSLGDYAAIVTMAIERVSGGGAFGHVLDAWMERAPVSAQINAAFVTAERFQSNRLILEEDTFKLIGLNYKTERARRQKAGQFWNVPILAVDHQETNKTARVASSEPNVTNGQITFSRSLPQVFWNQFVDHPTGDHDDGPDATEMAWRFGRRSGRSGLRLVTPPGANAQ